MVEIEKVGIVLNNRNDDFWGLFNIILNKKNLPTSSFEVSNKFLDVAVFSYMHKVLNERVCIESLYLRIIILG